MIAGLADGYAYVADIWAEAIRPRPRVQLSVWSDQNRILTESETSKPGKWSTDSVPFLREIMDNLSPHSPVQRIVFMKSTQVAGTEALINWVGATVDVYGGPMMVVEPTIEIAELLSKQRLANMIEACPALKEKIPPARSRDSGNTTLLKNFPGGVLRLSGANSAASLRSMPVRYLGLDEVDAYEQDLDGEGDPVGLAEERTNNFPRRKVFLISTPTIKGASRIEQEYEASDKRRYHVPCPHCGEKQVLKWSGIKWDEGITKAWYVCEHNGCVIEEFNKPFMLANGEWIPEHPERKARGYHINSLYSPIGLGRTWLDRVEQWIKAQSDPVQLKRFVNTCLGETWEDRSNEVKPNILKERAENFRMRTIPVGCLLLTCGVDTQDDRLELQLLGWGRNESCWVIDRLVIPGSPANHETWDALTKYLDTPVRNQFGIDMKITATAIDSGGHHTHDVYNYCRLNDHKRVFAIKGSSQAGRAILGRPSNVDVNWKGQTIKDGVQLWMVGTDTAKSTLSSRLIADTKLEVANRKIHFSADLELDYYEQLTSEAFDPDKNRWVKRTGRRNESLDTWVYAYAAALHPDVRIHVARESDWLKLESVVQPHVRDLFSEVSEQSAAPPEPPALPEPVVPNAQIETRSESPASAGLSHSGDNWIDDKDWF